MIMYTMGYTRSASLMARAAKQTRTHVHDYTYIDLYVKYLYACNLNF